MLDNKYFWICQNLLLLGIYACAVSLVAGGNTDSFMVWLAGIILALHVLEVPIAMMVLSPQNPAPARLLVCTLLFGITWWLPARKGMYEVF